MKRLNLLPTSESLVAQKTTKFLAGVLILLIAFNLGWIITLVRICSDLAIVKNLDQVIVNLNLLLIVGNSSILLLFLGYVFFVRIMRGILGRKA